MVWLQAHIATIALYIGLIAPTVVVGVTNYPTGGGWKYWLSVFLQIFSVVTHKDSPGSVKLPLLQYSKAPKNGANGSSVAAPITTATKTVAILLMASMALSGCQWVKRTATDLEACALDQLPKNVMDIIPEVIVALEGTPEAWAAELTKLEGMGMSFCVCVVKTAIARITSSGLATPANLAEVQHKVALASDRAAIALAKYGVKMPAPKTFTPAPSLAPAPDAELIKK